MANKIYSVYDSKAEAWIEPQISKNNATAIRSWFKTLSSDNVFSQHPADFTLFCIGEWDEFTGVIKPLEAKQPLMTALEVLAQIKNGDELEQRNGLERRPEDITNG